jgi:hypothetical protein
MALSAENEFSSMSGSRETFKAMASSMISSKEQFPNCTPQGV